MFIPIAVVAWVLICVPMAFYAMIGGHEQFLLAYSLIMQFLTSSIAAVACFVTAVACSKDEVMRKVWTWLGAGVFFWAMGAILYAIYPFLHQGQETPYPWFSDLGYALFPPSIVVAFILFKRGMGIAPPNWGIVGGFIVFLAGLALYITFNINKLADSNSWMAYAITIIYTIENPLLLGGIVVTASIVAGGLLARPLWLVLIGLLCYCSSDLVYMYLNIHQQYQTGNIIDLGWMIGFGFITVAALMTRALLLEIYAVSPNIE